MIQHDRRPRAARAPRPRLLAPFAVLALAAGCGSHTFGDRDQTGPDGSSPATVELQGGGTSPRVDLPGRVSAFVRVVNADETPAAGLESDDFYIYEGGQLVSRTESFQQIRAEPQTFRNFVHLILDRSNSVLAANNGQGESNLVESATEFVQLLVPANAAPGSTFIKVSWFDGAADLHPISGYDIGYSNNHSDLVAALAALPDEATFNPSTNLYGAVDQGLDDLDAIEALAIDDGVPNRALTLVTFTDGTHQTGGALTASDLVSKIEAGSTAQTPYSAFTIGVGAEIDTLVLAALGPNGSVARDDFGTLLEAFQEVGNSVFALANSYYNLSYCSPKTSGEWELVISVQPLTSTEGHDSIDFDANFFGAGCAFFDVATHADASAVGQDLRITDAVELDTGEVVMVGWRSATCDEPGCGAPSRAFVARMRASEATATSSVTDGTPDPNFGDGGYVWLEDLGTGYEVSGATSVVVDPSSGQLHVGGWSRASALSGFSQATLWTVDADGTSVTRTAIGTQGGADESVTDLVRTASGELVAGGFRGSVGARSFALWRFFSNLAPDNGFGVDGRVLEPATPVAGNEGVTDLVLGGGGRVYAVGRVDERVRVLARNAVSGAAMTGFGGDGTVDLRDTVDGQPRTCRPGGATLDGSGRLLVAGSYRDTGPDGIRWQPAVWRVLESGVPDSTFRSSPASPSANTGIATLRTGSTNDENRDFSRDTVLTDITLAPDGTILVTGWRLNAEFHTDLAIIAFDDQGVAEGDYNLVGFAIHDGATADDSFDEAAVVRVLDSGAVWALGVSNASAANPDPAGAGDIPTVWVDRDPERVFAPLGN